MSAASTGRDAPPTRAPRPSAWPELIRRLRRHHPAATIHGHREFAAKACPCFNAAEYSSLRPDDAGMTDTRAPGSA